MSDFQPQTTFYLLKDIKLDHSYTNTMDFDTKEEQYNYFFSKKAFEVLEGTYQRKTVGVVRVPFLYDDIATCNYIMWQNANYSDKWYYAFILEIKYINPNLSEIIYDLDVIQTYMFDIKWEVSQIDRDMSYRKELGGSPVINREIEDLNYGTDYNTIYEQNIVQIPNVSFMVFGCAPFNSEVIFPNKINNIPTNLCYFIVPIYTAREGEGDNKFFYFNNTELTTAEHMFELFTYTKQLVNRLVSVKLYPFLPYNFEYNVIGNKIYLTSTSYELFNYSTSDIKFTVMSANRNNFESEYSQVIFTNKYEKCPTYDETKLLMFPYTFGVLTNKRGQDFVVKLEDLEDGGITLIRQGSISPSPKLTYLIGQYNIDPYSTSLPQVGGYKFDQTQGIIEDVENDLPIIDDYTASYLQSNSNSIKVANSNAKLLQQSAIERANNTYDTSKTVLNRKSEQALTNYGTDMVRASISGVTGTASSVASGSIGYFIQGMGDTADKMIGATQNFYNAQEGIRQSAIIEANVLKNANISANTDYQVAVASNNAKVQDASCVPPTSKQLGGDYLFNILHKCDGIYFQIKTIKPYYAEKLQDYFKRYGYKQNAMRLPYLHSRENWNYVKCTQANIYGNVPQNDLLKIRDIYMQGITLWHTNKVGDYSLSNNDLNPNYATIIIEKDEGVKQTDPVVGETTYDVGTDVALFFNWKDGYETVGWWDYQLNILHEGNEMIVKANGTKRFKAITRKL